MTWATPHPILFLLAQARRVGDSCFVWPQALYASRAQRYAYRLVHGPLPPGREIRPRCGTPGYLSPFHAEAHRIGVREGVTHCKHGHRYEPGSYYLQPNGRGGMVKRCKTCHRASGERYRRSKGLTVRSDQIAA